MAQFELTPETWGVIIDFLEQGNFPETAAAVAGIPKRVMRQWLELGAQGDLRYAAFHADCVRAMGSAESRWVGALDTVGMAGDPKSIQWLLERRFPEKYGAKVRHIVQQEIDGIVGRIEALEGTIGASVVNQVLAAIAGESGAGETEGETGGGLH